jgi:hypothetical protein
MGRRRGKMADSVDDFPASLGSEMPQSNMKILRDAAIFYGNHWPEKMLPCTTTLFPLAGVN